MVTATGGSALEPRRQSSTATVPCELLYVGLSGFSKKLPDVGVLMCWEPRRALLPSPHICPRCRSRSDEAGGPALRGAWLPVRHHEGVAGLLLGGSCPHAG